MYTRLIDKNCALFVCFFKPLVVLGLNHDGIVRAFGDIFSELMNNLEKKLLDQKMALCVCYKYLFISHHSSTKDDETIFSYFGRELKIVFSCIEFFHHMHMKLAL